MIMKLIHRLGRQNLAIRDDVEERSNFFTFFHDLAEDDPILQEHIKKSEKLETRGEEKGLWWLPFT